MRRQEEEHAEGPGRFIPGRRRHSGPPVGVCVERGPPEGPGGLPDPQGHADLPQRQPHPCGPDRPQQRLASLAVPGAGGWVGLRVELALRF